MINFIMGIFFLFLATLQFYIAADSPSFEFKRKWYEMGAHSCSITGSLEESLKNFDEVYK